MQYEFCQKNNLSLKYQRYLNASGCRDIRNRHILELEVRIFWLINFQWRLKFNEFELRHWITYCRFKFKFWVVYNSFWAFKIVQGVTKEILIKEKNLDLFKQYCSSIHNWRIILIFLYIYRVIHKEWDFRDDCTDFIFYDIIILTYLYFMI